MSWLKEKTGYDAAYWMARVQTLIAQHTSEPKPIPELDNNLHGTTDTLAWLKTLIEEVNKLKPSMCIFDENMWMAAVLSMILCLWFSSTQRAKCLDPNRPVDSRMQAMNRHMLYTQCMFSAMTDYSQLSTYFPGQRWDLPFTPNAMSGSFK